MYSLESSLSHSYFLTILSLLVINRSFGGVAKYVDGLRELESLKEKLKAAGKQFIENKFDAAGYDAPWELINRHNEIWLHALKD